MKLIFENLPKISNNKFYAGVHWAERKKLVDKVKTIVRMLLYSQTKRRSFSKPCDVEYIFEFKSRPLDCSNTIGMLKIIEDVLFPDDSIKIVRSLKIVSVKSVENKVTVIINERQAGATTTK